MWFAKSGSVGRTPQGQARMNPIPLPTIALVATAVRLDYLAV